MEHTDQYGEDTFTETATDSSSSTAHTWAAPEETLEAEGFEPEPPPSYDEVMAHPDAYPVYDGDPADAEAWEADEQWLYETNSNDNSYTDANTNADTYMDGNSNTDTDTPKYEDNDGIDNGNHVA